MCVCPPRFLVLSSHRAEGDSSFWCLAVPVYRGCLVGNASLTSENDVLLLMLALTSLHHLAHAFLCFASQANYHAARVYKNMLPQYLVGEVTDCPVYVGAPRGELHAGSALHGVEGEGFTLLFFYSADLRSILMVLWHSKRYPHVADFREARQQMLREGLFETDMMYYYKLGSWLAFLFRSALALSLDFVGGGTFGAHMLGAAILGIFWQQLAGVGHDLGHSGVTHDFHTDHKLGSFLSSLMGMSKKKINLLAQNALENTDGVGAPTPIKGGSDPVAPHQCPLGKLAMLCYLFFLILTCLQTQY